MTVLLWLLLLFVGFVTALASSAKLRKNAFIWFSYVTITGWYYCRVLHKKYAGDNNKEAVGASPPPSSSGSNKNRVSSTSRAGEGRRDPDLVYFESREVVERRQHEQQDGLERSGVSERSSHMSDSGSSGGSDVGAAIPSKRKRSLFHSRRKAAAEEAVRRVSDASSADLLTNSGVSEVSDPVTPTRNTRNSATRRTYTGRKKPESWAD
ncbi:hypothetical protein F441_04327 [Phytophthora nicotianae CJ01A1]|uniref:Uncharacterized protein n=6 Tax=Phytophthora nicotianae TaxID=4792 RepID=W2PDL5_PHYN3|nr:hypothetical protein PPTG_24672 [Phytophthora nicotianae INRA-310]ETI52502.1 hypothetical protein F443_04365 [Phytophthora nicotianae P1569]ETK92391.1 hypothetical protein L915_04235 [Phytophthora nicotianae]ETO81277.1 hypothetical protein F444_04383 [Phytophthora nicotianae P1976]ETP22334.1 hypothetical protein F441_04327 [Phytophthora nicotianae CJ01A1]ETP50225.1 hypothetical protein F442_04393 [Phytophthora nicotianae P10297]KUF89656.1 WD repeat-containing protein 6 [Phytophthora nicoti